MPLQGAGGHSWDLVNGQVTVDGVVDNTTIQVIALQTVYGEIWQENSGHLWWEKVLPSDQWAPDNGSATGPFTQVSANNTTVLQHTNQTLVDDGGNTWGINSAGRATVNGKIDPTTWYVTKLAVVDGVVYQENINNDWWSKPFLAADWVAHGKAGPLTDIVTLGPNQSYMINNPTGFTIINGAKGDTIYGNDYQRGNSQQETDTVNGSGMQFIAGQLRAPSPLTGNSATTINGNSNVFTAVGPNDTINFTGNNNAAISGGGTCGMNFNNGLNCLAVLNASASVANMGAGSIVDFTPGAASLFIQLTNVAGAAINVHGVSQAVLNADIAAASYVQHTDGNYQFKVGNDTINTYLMPNASQFHAV